VVTITGLIDRSLLTAAYYPTCLQVSSMTCLKLSSVGVVNVLLLRVNLEKLLISIENAMSTRGNFIGVPTNDGSDYLEKFTKRKGSCAYN
jgi:hypothetical protein